MPKYRIKLSDGRTVTVEAAQPPSEQDILGALGQSQNAPATPVAQPPDRMDADMAAIRSGAPLSQLPSERARTAQGARAMPTIGGTIGGFMGGIPGAAAGGAIGRAVQQVALPQERPMSTGGQLAEMGMSSLTQGALQGGGALIGGALRTAGRGFYRAGALPLQNMMKYGDLIKKGIEAHIPVTKAGLEKAGALKTTAQAKKATALSAADERASILTGQVAREATGELGQGNAKLLDAGLPSQASKIADRARRFTQQHERGVKPSHADEIKGTLDDRLGGAHQKIRQKQPLTPTEQQDMAYKNALSRGLEDTVPNYKGMNKDVMDAVGLQRMIGRRVNPGSGGNQGLENALMIAGGPAAIPARLMMLPQVASSMGIGLHEIGKRAPNAASNAVRALILAQLENEQ